MKKIKGCQRSYVEQLDPEPKKRYQDKLKLINDFDPREAGNKAVWCYDLDLLPATTYLDIVNYLVYGISFYTAEQFKAYKGLEAYKQFCDGFVHDLMIFKPRNCNNIVVTAQVMHSQRMNAKPLSPWVILSTTGQILTGHCTCMAGIAETCTHISALLFKIEAVIRMREKTTITGVAAYWMIPTNVERIGPKIGHSINFTSSESKKKQLDRSLKDPSTDQKILKLRTSQKSKSSIPAPSAEEINTFMQELYLTGDNAAILAVTPAFCEKFKDPIDPVIYPISLRKLRSSKFDGSELLDLVKHCESLLSKANVTVEQAAVVEQNTRKQDKTPAWYSMRAGRITASNLHGVCHTDINTPSVSVIRKVCYPEENQRVAFLPATKWGKRNEKLAREKYVSDNQQKHSNLTVRECGLFINPNYPYIGASPDGCIQCTCCGNGILEIKCPYKHKQSALLDACNDRDFFLCVNDDKMLLKTGHQYYTQIQCQIFVTQSAFCDLAVWTAEDFTVIRVLPDEQFWNTCKAQAEIFFKKVILPELVAHHFTAKSEHSRKCQKEPVVAKHSKRARIENLTKTSTNDSQTKQIKLPLQVSLSPVKQTQQNHKIRVKKTKKSLWCYCRKGEDYDDMVACDNANCQLVWFHLRCVGLDKCPSKDEAWFCPDCKQ